MDGLVNVQLSLVVWMDCLIYDTHAFFVELKGLLELLTLFVVFGHILRYMALRFMRQR